jgi:hypothetical protein
MKMVCINVYSGPYVKGEELIVGKIYEVDKITNNSSWITIVGNGAAFVYPRRFKPLSEIIVY